MSDDVNVRAHGELCALGFAVTGKLDSDSTPEVIGHAVRRRIEDLEVEGRRLRQIISAIAENGGGVGALVECYRSPVRSLEGEFVGIIVCRADRDEVAFCGDVIEGMRDKRAVERWAEGVARGR